MSQPDPCAVIRIAIALVALKHKPRDQSIASYVLDLQSHFPVTNREKDSQDWRKYALELERQLASVKAERDADQEVLSKLRADASQAASTSDGPPPKKKSKKNPTKDQREPEWSWDQSRADWSHFLTSQYPPSPSLVAAYTSLKGSLVSSNADLLAYASRVSGAILRALDAVHVFLFSPPNPTADPHAQAATEHLQCKPEHIDSTRIALTSPLIMYVLRTALHTLVRTVRDSTAKSKRTRLRPAPHASGRALTSAGAHADVDRILNRLLESILLPLIRAFVPLCSARLAPLLSEQPKKVRNRSNLKADRPIGKTKDKEKEKKKGNTSTDPPKQNDARTDAFALIGALLEALDALPPLARPPGAGGSGSIASGIRDRLGLETIRELEVLYAVTVSSSPFASQPFSSHQPVTTSSQRPPATLSEAPPLPTPTSLPTLSQSRARPDTLPKRIERLAGTRADRVRALVTRDAGWFLASTLNLCVGPGSSSADVSLVTAGDRLGGVLRDALLERVGKLATSVSLDECVSDDAARSKPVIDPVCQNILLAVCERALGQLAPL